MIRKLLGAAAVAVALSSCGGGGLGGETQGFYRLGAGIVRANTSTCVLNYSLNADGSLKSYQINPDSDFAEIQIYKAYTANVTNPMPMYLTGIDLIVGGYDEKIPVTGEITESGITVDIPLSVGVKIFSPLIYANILEDQPQTYAFTQTLAQQSDFWNSVEKEFDYNGTAISAAAEGVPIEDVQVTAEGQACPVYSNGTIGYPCNGTVDFTTGQITINSVDPSLLTTSHSSVITYDYDSNGQTQQFLLSPSVQPSTVSLSDAAYGIAIKDDGNGNLTLNGTNVGTVDYANGTITLSIPESDLPSQVEESNETTYVGFNATGTLDLGTQVKPLSIQMTAMSSTPDDPNSAPVAFCTDDGSGNLIGNCTGTVDYANGTINYTWDSTVSAVSVYLAYTSLKTVHPALNLDTSWQSADSSAHLVVSYLVQKSTYPTDFTVNLPPQTSLTSLTLYDGTNTFANYTETAAGSVVTIHITSVPQKDLTASVTADRTFNFNPAVLVADPHPVTVTGTIRVNAVLADGEKLTAELPITISGESCLDTTSTTTTP